jgi:hypothetical protein
MPATALAAISPLNMIVFGHDSIEAFIVVMNSFLKII